MALKRKESRFIMSDTTPKHHFRSLNMPPGPSKTPKQERSTYITAVDISPVSHLRKKIHDKKKLTDVAIKCHRHPFQTIKFIDVSSEEYDALCEMCITSSDYILKKIKLERILDITNALRKDTMKFIEELEKMQQKYNNLSKDVIKNNANSSVLMIELDAMEKKVNKIVKDTFSKIRGSFVKANPFKENRELIKYKIEENIENVQILESNSEDALDLIRDMLEK